MIHFHYPLHFFFVIPVSVIFFIFLWSKWKRRRDLQKLGDWKLIQQLVEVPALIRRKRKDIFAFLGLLFLFLSATGPQWGSRLKEVKHRGVDVFIAMDTSRSMLAEDVAPSRLDRAKRSLGLLIRKCEGNRLGIIAFAKQAVIQCPLTVDTEAAQMFLEILDDKTVPVQGTSIGDAIRLAVNSFPKNDRSGRAVVLLTDGEDHESDPIGAAEEAKKAGVVLFTIGIGTPKGEVIKNKDEYGKVTEFHKYKGEMVLSRLDDGMLTKIAMITGGHYYRASSTDQEIDEIAEIINSFEKKEYGSKTLERFEERYQIFGLIAFLLLLVEFFFGERPQQWNRVRAALQKSLLLLFIILFSGKGIIFADISKHLRQGNALIKKGDLIGARVEFEAARTEAPEEAILPYNIANTYYMEGKMEEAKKQYEQAMMMAKTPDLKSKISYNWGHLLFSMKQREAAVEKFKECLRLQPKDVDAKYNIEYIRSGKQPPPPPSNQNKNEKSESDKKNQQEKKENNDSSQDKDGEKQKNEPVDGQQGKEGQMSKEDAERVLQMLQAQESEKMKGSKPAQAGILKKQERKNNAGEDW